MTGTYDLDGVIRWKPKRGSIVIRAVPGGWRVECACGWSYPDPERDHGFTATPTKADATTYKRLHYCPPGSPNAHPVCPDCGADGVYCRDLTRGGTAAHMHPARLQAYHDRDRLYRAATSGPANLPAAATAGLPQPPGGGRSPHRRPRPRGGSRPGARA